MGDPQVRARMKLPGGDRWYLLKAIQTIIQMSGRGVRSELDYCDCVYPGTMILTANLEWKVAATLKVGDKILGFDERTSRLNPRKWRWASVEATGIKELPRYRIILENGTMLISTPNHQWLSKWGQSKNDKWLRTDQLKVGHHLNRYVNIWEQVNNRDIGWLAGLFDGEGSLILRCGQRNPTVMRIVLSQKLGQVLDKAKSLLDEYGFKTELRVLRTGVANLFVNGGLKEHLRFLGQVRPDRLLTKYFESGRQERLMARSHDKIVSIEFIGNGPMITLQSSTETYIAEGYGAHNTYILDRQFGSLRQRMGSAFPSWWLEAIKGGGKIDA